jgi:hypothetical protein
MYKIYDIEIFPNLFMYSDIDINTLETNTFYFFNDNFDQYESFINYLSKIKGHIGFNSLNYDYPILHWLWETDDLTNKKIYDKSQEIIKSEYTAIPHWKEKIKQCDLYRIHHFSNKANRTSLKDVQIAIRWKKVQDLPYHYSHIVKENELELIKSYNLDNDCGSTLEFYKLSLELIKLRRDLSKEFGLNMLNYDDPKLGSEMFLDIMSKNMNIPKPELRLMRTVRSSINFEEIILPYIKFESKEFNELLDTFKSKIITQTKNSIKESIIYKGLQYDYGTGGIHACIKPGVYSSNSEESILDIDVASFYPNLAIINNFRPEHLGDVFGKIYKNTFDTRKTIPKNNPLNGAYKLILNGIFGKSNEETSWLYDPKFTMQVTVNGQLLITMLAEKLANVGCVILQCNTDGITIKHNNSLKSEIDKICNWFQEITQLQLEYQGYKKMVIRDVNNYLSVGIDNKPKYKGCFEIIKTQNGNIAYNKDWSNRIIPIALSEYFVNNIPVEETIKSHREIYDFCGRFKATFGWHSETRYIENNKEKRNKQQKTNRYYISTNGNVYYKCHSDGREEAIEKGFKVTIFNDFVEKDFKDYNINYNYYIKECYKILDVIENKQLELF